MLMVDFNLKIITITVIWEQYGIKINNYYLVFGVLIRFDFDVMTSLYSKVIGVYKYISHIGVNAVLELETYFLVFLNVIFFTVYKGSNNRKEYWIEQF